MEEAPETLELAQRQKNADEQEIQTLRRHPGEKNGCCHRSPEPQQRRRGRFSLSAPGTNSGLLDRIRQCRGCLDQPPPASVAAAIDFGIIAIWCIMRPPASTFLCVGEQHTDDNLLACILSLTRLPDSGASGAQRFCRARIK
jgi:hypothetical protein